MHRPEIQPVLIGVNAIQRRFCRRSSGGEPPFFTADSPQIGGEFTAYNLFQLV